jgi:hypothetical protein
VIKTNPPRLLYVSNTRGLISTAGGYYPLLSQGAAGEGDKETFLATVSGVDDPFYQVSELICAIGHRTEGGLAGSAMVQADPRYDHALAAQGIYLPRRRRRRRRHPHLHPEPSSFPPISRNSTRPRCSQSRP